MKRQPIADTGLIVGLLNPNDQHHAWSRESAFNIVGGFLTCEAVISEADFLVYRTRAEKMVDIVLPKI